VTFVRRHFPDFDWVRFDTPSPRRLLPVPLSQARVGLVVTAGAHLPGETAFGTDGEVRFLPAGTETLELSHPGYDTRRAMADPDVVVPVPSLRRLVEAGVVGSLAPTVISTMGLVPRGEDVLERSVPAAVDRLRAEEVDLALLVPA
jgi:D-proline reductase (dithiol) PrdB